jgi:UDP-N-acetyl-D-mannosaminuronic acid dehydrogenase
VPTPERDHRSDLECLRNAATSITPYLQRGNLVSSNRPFRRCDRERRAAGAGASKLTPARIILSPTVPSACCPVDPQGADRERPHHRRLTPACAARAETLYRTFVQGRIELCICVRRDGQAGGKVVSRRERAFANTVSNVAVHLGVSSARVIALANMHPRVNILQPGRRRGTAFRSIRGF